MRCVIVLQFVRLNPVELTLRSVLNENAVTSSVGQCVGRHMHTSYPSLPAQGFELTFLRYILGN